MSLKRVSYEGSNRNCVYIPFSSRYETAIFNDK